MMSAGGDLWQQLHAANCRLCCLLDSLSQNPAERTARLRGATPQQMGGLLSELMRAGEGLRALPAERSRELEQELSDYQKNVERLRRLLPAIHDSLLQERARLEQERMRLESAAEWARRSRETL